MSQQIEQQGQELLEIDQKQYIQSEPIVIDVAPLLDNAPSDMSHYSLPRHDSIDTSTLQSSVSTGCSVPDNQFRDVRLGTESTTKFIDVSRSSTLYIRPKPLVASTSCSEIYQPACSIEIDSPYSRFSSGSCIDYSIKNDFKSGSLDDKKIYPTFMVAEENQAYGSHNNTDTAIDMSIRLPFTDFIKVYQVYKERLQHNFLKLFMIHYHDFNSSHPIYRNSYQHVAIIYMLGMYNKC